MALQKLLHAVGKTITAPDNTAIRALKITAYALNSITRSQNNISRALKIIARAIFKYDLQTSILDFLFILAILQNTGI